MLHGVYGMGNVNYLQ